MLLAVFRYGNDVGTLQVKLMLFRFYLLIFMLLYPCCHIHAVRLLSITRTFENHSDPNQQARQNVFDNTLISF
jgi:hypothetical protein